MRSPCYIDGPPATLPDVSRGTRERLGQYVDLVLSENERQNLVAKSTVQDFWDRHIADCLQLVPLIRGSSLVDVGSGAGLPGIVIAIATGSTMRLVEPRRRRAEFLSRATSALGLGSHTTVHQARIEAISRIIGTTIVARAYAPLAAVFASATHVASEETRWVLPKGKSARHDLADALETWQGEFTLHASVTDPEASIIVAERVRRRR